MKALVSGATGFIGGAIAAALARSGWDVNVLVRPSSRCRLPAGHPYRMFEANLDDESPVLRQAAAGCEVVIHAAAIRDLWGTSPEAYRQTNVEGTRRLLDACLGQASRFVYISSVGVLSYPGMTGIHEGLPVRLVAGKAAYHRSKAEAERVVAAYGNRIETVVVRPTITYGPGDRNGMLTRLIALIAAGKFIRIGRAKNHFHLTYIDDLVAGVLVASAHPLAVGETFILAGPRSIQVNELLAMIEARLGCPAPRLYIPERVARTVARGVEALYRLGRHSSVPGFAGTPVITQDKIDTICVHRSFSSEKAARLLGYRPCWDYAGGLEATLQWMAAESILNRHAGRKRVGAGSRGAAWTGSSAYSDPEESFILGAPASDEPTSTGRPEVR